MSTKSDEYRRKAEQAEEFARTTRDLSARHECAEQHLLTPLIEAVLRPELMRLPRSVRRKSERRQIKLC